MKLPGDITLGDFIFNTIDDQGITWVITNIVGWWQHPDADVPDIDRAIGDGGYDVVGRYKARQLTLEGVFLCPDPDMVESARDRLIEATNLVYNGAWLKTGFNPKRSSFVRISGSPKIETVNARGRTEFSIGLRAADPIKYEWNDAEPDGYTIVEIPGRNDIAGSPGSETVVNIGNYRAPALLEISGPIVSPATIYNRTTDELILITSPIGGVNKYRIESKQLTFDETKLVDVATLTFDRIHNLRVGYEIDITGVSAANEPFDGSFVISAVPTDTSISYDIIPDGKIFSIYSKELENGIASIDTVNALPAGITASLQDTEANKILISGVDNVFDGTYYIRSISNDRQSFTFNKTRIPPQAITGKAMAANVATLTTQNPHGLILGESVTVSGVDAQNFDRVGAVITALPSDRQFSYAVARTDAKSIKSRVMNSGLVTISTGTPAENIAHGFVAGETVDINLVGPSSASFTGAFQIFSVPSSNTLTYFKDRVTNRIISFVARTSNVSTVTTLFPHGLSRGERVSVSGITTDTTFNATNVQITSTPSDRTFTYSQAGNNTLATPANSGALATPTSREVIRRAILGNEAFLTTQSNHGLFEGESITVSVVGSPWNGTHVVKRVPSPNTFVYDLVAANVAEQEIPGVQISTRSTTGTTKIATMTTPVAHNLIANQRIIISGVDTTNAPKAAGFNGTFNVLSVPNANTFTYESNTKSSSPMSIQNATWQRFTVTVRTASAHGIESGNSVQIAGIVNFGFLNGVFTVNVTGPDTFTYVSPQSTPEILDPDSDPPGGPTGEYDIFTLGGGKTVLDNVLTGAAPLTALVRPVGYVATSGNIASSDALTGSTVVGNGNIPFSAATGLVTPPTNIPLTQASGNAIKKSDIQFTPGVSSDRPTAVATYGPEILEIDTRTRDVFFNGTVEGARAKIDVLADFINFAPGENIIEFEDSGEPQSEALLKVYYRSGWLG
jgi:hypothetical protein